MAIGRLDEKSEGLLLLTTDGKMSYHISSNKIEKEYYAQVDGEITPEAMVILSNGIQIAIEGQNYTTQPCLVKAISNEVKIPVMKHKIRDNRHGPTSWVSITLREGKFRQVRKMTAAAGFPTLRLVRVRIGNILLNDMPSGTVIPVTELLV